MNSIRALGAAALAAILALSCGSPQSGLAQPPAAQAPAAAEPALAEIQVSAGSLSPSFSPATLAYQVAVDGTVASVTVSGSPARQGVSVSPPVTLAGLEPGVPRTATVTATEDSDAGSKREYSVTVTRALLPARKLIVTGFPEGTEGGEVSLAVRSPLSSGADLVTATGRVVDRRLSLVFEDPVGQGALWTGSVGRSYALVMSLPGGGSGQKRYFPAAFPGGAGTTSYDFSQARKLNGGIDFSGGTLLSVYGATKYPDGTDALVKVSYTPRREDAVASQLSSFYEGTLQGTRFRLPDGSAWTASAPYYVFLEFPGGEEAEPLFAPTPASASAMSTYFAVGNFEAYRKSLRIESNTIGIDTVLLCSSASPGTEVARAVRETIPSGLGSMEIFYFKDSGGAFWYGDPAASYYLLFQVGPDWFSFNSTIPGGALPAVLSYSAIDVTACPAP